MGSPEAPSLRRGSHRAKGCSTAQHTLLVEDEWKQECSSELLVLLSILVTRTPLSYQHLILSGGAPTLTSLNRKWLLLPPQIPKGPQAPIPTSS